MSSEPRTSSGTKPAIPYNGGFEENFELRVARPIVKYVGVSPVAIYSESIQSDYIGNWLNMLLLDIDREVEKTIGVPAARRVFHYNVEVEFSNASENFEMKGLHPYTAFDRKVLFVDSITKLSRPTKHEASGSWKRLETIIRQFKGMKRMQDFRYLNTMEPYGEAWIMDMEQLVAKKVQILEKFT